MGIDAAIAAADGEARVTMPPMIRALATGLLLVALAGCGEVGWGASGEAADVAAAAKAAQEARAGLDDLDRRVATLEDDADAARSAARRIDRVTVRLRRALDRLRESIQGIRTDAGEAAAAAESSASRAEQLGRVLSVLEARLDYHLRRAH